MEFIELPLNYQRLINSEIVDCIGDDYPEVAKAFRDWEAQYLSEVVIDEDNDLTGNEEFRNDLIAFKAGYEVGKKDR